MSSPVVQGSPCLLRQNEPKGSNHTGSYTEGILNDRKLSWGAHNCPVSHCQWEKWISCMCGQEANTAHHTTPGGRFTWSCTVLEHHTGPTSFTVLLCTSTTTDTQFLNQSNSVPQGTLAMPGDILVITENMGAPRIRQRKPSDTCCSTSYNTQPSPTREPTSPSYPSWCHRET